MPVVGTKFMRILIVDDDEAFCVATERYLRARGYETDRAVDGLDALDRLEGSCPDLILCDIRMPRMGGIALLKKVREACDVPFVMVTGHRGENETVEAMKAGAKVVLDKPVDPGRLLECLQESR